MLLTAATEAITEVATAAASTKDDRPTIVIELGILFLMYIILGYAEVNAPTDYSFHEIKTILRRALLTGAAIGLAIGLSQLLGIFG